MPKAKIMIVEDEVVVSTDIRMMLIRLDYAVCSVVRYGEKVMENVVQHNPDLILMDINLKGEMNGTKAAVLVQEKYSIPIIFLTAFSDEETVSEALKSGPYAYLKKPIHSEDLKVALEATLYRKKIDNEKEQLIKKLEAALAEIKMLRGLLPICSSCKKIRDDKGEWNLLESYIERYSEAKFSHGICPECSDKFYGNEDWYIEMKKE